MKKYESRSRTSDTDVWNTAAGYRRYERYRGEHDMSFATEKFESAFGSMFREIAMNLCAAIVDAVKDKLEVADDLRSLVLTGRH